MNIVLSVFGVVGVVACYEIARFHMSARTRHSIRAGLILIGVGCALAAFVWADPALMPWALISILTGCGFYRVACKREVWDEHRNPGGAGPVANLALVQGGRTDDGGQTGDAVHRHGLRAVGG
jgi:hypothetical protein